MRRLLLLIHIEDSSLALIVGRSMQKMSDKLFNSVLLGRLLLSFVNQFKVLEVLLRFLKDILRKLMSIQEQLEV